MAGQTEAALFGACHQTEAALFISALAQFREHLFSRQQATVGRLRSTRASMSLRWLSGQKAACLMHNRQLLVAGVQTEGYILYGK